MEAFAIIYALLLAHTVAFVALSVGLARVAGARIDAIAIGTPPLVRVKTARRVVQLGPFPSGSVELHGRAAVDDDGAPGGWKRLGLARRLLVILGPWLLLMIVAVALLGPAHALRSFVHAFDQVLFTVDVTPLVRRFLDLVATAPITTTAGIVLAKMVAVNLLPAVGFAGANTIVELLGPRVPRWFATYGVIALFVVTLWVLPRFGWAVIQVVT
jgi:hypothetical protein